MIETNFDRRIVTPEKLAVWFTFWSDAQLCGRYRAAGDARGAALLSRRSKWKSQHLLHGSRRPRYRAPTHGHDRRLLGCSPALPKGICAARAIATLLASSTSRGGRQPALAAARPQTTVRFALISPIIPPWSIPCAAISPMTPERLWQEDRDHIIPPWIDLGTAKTASP